MGIFCPFTSSQFLLALLFRSYSSIDLHVEAESLRQFIGVDNIKYRNIYPYNSRQLKVIFVYGTDNKRGMDIFRLSRSVKLAIGLITMLLVAATITLYTIRSNLKLPSNSIASSIMDCLIPFIGGGNLRMKHRMERWFFGILLIGSFFVVSVFGGDLLDSIVNVRMSRIEHFGDLPKISTPCFCDKRLVFNWNEIAMLFR